MPQRRTSLLAILAVLLAALLAGCGLFGENATPTPDLSSLFTSAPPANAAAAIPTPPPDLPPTSIPTADDPLAVVLDGIFANGGVWTWDDIALLPNQPNGPSDVWAESTLTPATLNETGYAGVPVAHLLVWAGMPQSPLTMSIADRGGQRYSYAPQRIATCADCILVRTAENTITLILPGFEPPIVENLARIEVR